VGLANERAELMDPRMAEHSLPQRTRSSESYFSSIGHSEGEKSPWELLLRTADDTLTFAPSDLHDRKEGKA